jgi:hypothetical protein
LLGNRKKIAKFYNEDIYMPLYLPLWFKCSKFVTAVEGAAQEIHQRVLNYYADKYIEKSANFM